MTHNQTFLTIVVFEGVKAMGGCGENGADVVLGKVLEVLLHKHLEEAFLTHPANFTSTAGFLVSEGREVETHPVETCNHGPCHILDPGVVRGRATDKIEVFRLVSLRKDLHIQSFGPLAPLVFHSPPGIPILVSTFKSVDDRFRNVAFLDERCPHADDQIRRSQFTGAAYRAGFTGAASP